LLFPRYVRAADGIIAVSETARQDLIRFLGVEATRITTVHHGVDEIFRKEPGSDDLARVKRRYGLPDRYLLYCGQIYPPKNFGRLIRSFADVGPSLDLSLVVAGSRTWLSKNEVDEVERLGLEHRVLRLGWVPRQDLPALYSLAEALVMPSLYESFGLPLLEAMCAGCPVLTSNRRGPREVVDDAAVLVEPEDLDSISEGMRRVVEDGKLRDDLISRGRRRAATFSWKRCASQTLQALENLEQGA
jgi:glycosyltransferase involved in cell wall biosynthesis